MIRSYYPDDFPALYALEEICFEPPIRYSRLYLRRLIASPDAATWVAEEDAQIAGFTVIEWYDDSPSFPAALGTRQALAADLDLLHGSHEESCRAAYIQTIEVAPAFRRRGVASELLRYAEISARAARATLIWLHVESTNEAAIHLYRAHGFIHRGQEDHYYARGRNADIYSKTLKPDPCPPQPFV
jgi:ribosomal protein S18 acetylase RimI-like enzyme